MTTRIPDLPGSCGCWTAASEVAAIPFGSEVEEVEVLEALLDSGVVVDVVSGSLGTIVEVDDERLKGLEMGAKCVSFNSIRQN